MSHDAGLPLPPPFLAHPGTPPVPWAQWERRFNIYLTARGGETSVAQKRALLLCAIGDEAYRVYENLPTLVKGENETDYDVTLRQLRNHYEPKTNVIVERFNFRQRAQHSHECTADYVTVLRGLARKCNFGNMEDELIRDQVVEKTPHHSLRQRLLQELDLDLDKLLNIAASYEQSLRQAAAIASPQPAVSTVAKVGLPKPAVPSSVATQCTNCGRRDHPTRDPSCPARRVTCSKCNKKGHFAVWCRGGAPLHPTGGPRPRRPHHGCGFVSLWVCSSTPNVDLSTPNNVSAHPMR